jgi:uncharacterized iron-regulated membrane protein
MADMTTGENPVYASKQRRPSRLFSVLALVAACIGAVLSFTGWAILLPVAAIVLGAIGARREKGARPFWLTAILLGVAGLIVSAIFLFLQYLTLMALIGYSST